MRQQGWAVVADRPCGVDRLLAVRSAGGAVVEVAAAPDGRLTVPRGQAARLSAVDLGAVAEAVRAWQWARAAER